MSSSAHAVTSIAELEALYGTPVPNAIAKETQVLTEAYRTWIEASPFVAVATVGPEGLDCSPRGDRPRAVHVLDDRTLVLADRRGNHRLDTLRNVVRDPRVALLFLVPGSGEAMRVNGRAHVSVDPRLLDACIARGRRPATVLVVSVEAVYFQCARAIKRSQLWNPASLADSDGLPTAGEMTRAADPDFDAEAYDAALEERQNRTLY